MDNSYYDDGMEMIEESLYYQLYWYETLQFIDNLPTKE